MDRQRRLGSMTLEMLVEQLRLEHARYDLQSQKRRESQDEENDVYSAV
ncbi:MAG: hypothetical protein NZO58_00550 [Gemmataceae bacterium]|nr:hypothetical protein [Gemmataceae bacterium]